MWAVKFKPIAGCNNFKMLKAITNRSGCLYKQNGCYWQNDKIYMTYHDPAPGEEKKSE